MTEKRPDGASRELAALKERIPSDHMPVVLVRGGEKPGDWNELYLGEVDRPRPEPEQVLVQVESCSVNRADLLQRRGLYPPPPGAPDILGLDFAGYVVERGAAVEEWRVGDRVFGIVAGGGYGRYVTVWADHLVPIPENLSFIEAAAVAEVFFTAYLNLFLEAGLRSGETLLVHGCGSGVGSAAIQLALRAGAKVLTTAGSEDRLARCSKLGPTAAFNYKNDDWPDRVMAATDGEGVDVILDWIGGAYLAKHMRLLKPGGRLVVIGLLGGRQAEIDLAPLLTGRLRVIGSVLRSRSREEKKELVRSFTRDVLPFLKERKVCPVVDRIYPVNEAEKAHQYMRGGGHFGKIVLSWSPVELGREGVGRASGKLDDCN